MSFYKKNKYYIILLLVFSILVYAEYTKPKPIDWTVTYSSEDKIPYGTFVLREELKMAFPEKGIIDNDKSYSQFFTEEVKASILLINYDFSPSSLDLELLLNHAKKGNNLFVAATYFSRKFSDTLGFIQDFGAAELLFTDSLHTLSFTHEKLANRKYIYKRALTNSIFGKFDTLKTTVLGNSENGVNFIKIKYGKGNVFIHLEPMVFTNYNLLAEKNFQYAFNSLSYLPYGEVIWDKYYQSGRGQNGKSARGVGQTPLYFILENPPLHYAWSILLLGMILYILFEGKRRQRIIPVITPPKNSSLEFVEIIGRLYLHRASHKDLAEKKFNYFTDFLRTNYHLKLNELTTEYSEKISEKTGTDKLLIVTIFNAYEQIASKVSISEKELFNFNTKIEDFYQQRK